MRCLRGIDYVIWIGSIDSFRGIPMTFNSRNTAQYRSCWHDCNGSGGSSQSPNRYLARFRLMEPVFRRPRLPFLVVFLISALFHSNVSNYTRAFGSSRDSLSENARSTLPKHVDFRSRIRSPRTLSLRDDRRPRRRVHRDWRWIVTIVQWCSSLRGVRVNFAPPTSGPTRIGRGRGMTLISTMQARVANMLPMGDSGNAFWILESLLVGCLLSLSSRLSRCLVQSSIISSSHRDQYYSLCIHSTRAALTERDKRRVNDKAR